MSLQAGPSSAAQSNRLKRTASKAALNPPSSPSASRLLTTPKKRPYTGPVVDPNPINPFAASPLRNSALKDRTTVQPAAISSPFLHASSPSKLKQLLVENSLRKIQSRVSPPNEITPRTKARKRLTGEMEETPMKARVRRKRGEGRGKSEPSADRSDDPPILGRSEALPGVVDDQEDEFGPTPVKQAGFSSFFEVESPARVNGDTAIAPPDSLMSRLVTAGRKGKERLEDPEVEKPAPRSSRSLSLEALDAAMADSPSRLSDPDGEQSNLESREALSSQPGPGDPASSRSPRRSRPEKVLSISDDESDEWDPEAGHVQHRVKIVPTRARPTRRKWSDDEWSDDEDHHDLGLQSEQEDLDGEDAGVPALDDTTTSQTNPSVPSPPPSLMSLLSLTSPNHRQGRYARLKELRYRALFNPNGADAQRLRAFQKGQEAFQSGETEADDENADLHALDQDEEQGDHADDDWESESDGWKRTGVEMDDDAW